MGSKSNRCVNLTLSDPTSLFFWALITILFILVIGNFILTLSIISFFKIGMGMESIELVPESKAIKFFGVTDFQKVYKKDGLIESFKDVPSVIEGEECALSLTG
jgi:beta-sarcoglycan